MAGPGAWPGARGTPLSVALAASNVRPGGSDPVCENAIGPTPPVCVNVTE